MNTEYNNKTKDIFILFVWITTPWGPTTTYLAHINTWHAHMCYFLLIKSVQLNIFNDVLKGLLTLGTAQNSRGFVSFSQ